MNTWHPQHNWQHWSKHGLIPVACLLLLLLVPQSWLIDVMKAPKIHRIELTLSTPQIEEKAPTPANEPEVSPPTEPLHTPQPVKKDTKPTPRTEPPKQAAAQKPNTESPRTETPQASAPPEAATQLSSGQVLRMMQQPTDVDISGSVFAPGTQNQQSFIPHTPVAQAWQSDLPYLDESVDRPRVEMVFYSEGFMGSVERFFDKITYEKTFTTKYGTKIHCALVALITVCSWK